METINFSKYTNHPLKLNLLQLLKYEFLPTTNHLAHALVENWEKVYILAFSQKLNTLQFFANTTNSCVKIHSIVV